MRRGGGRRAPAVLLWLSVGVGVVAFGWTLVNAPPPPRPTRGPFIDRAGFTTDLQQAFIQRAPREALEIAQEWLGKEPNAWFALYCGAHAAKQLDRPNLARGYYAELEVATRPTNADRGRSNQRQHFRGWALQGLGDETGGQRAFIANARAQRDRLERSWGSDASAAEAFSAGPQRRQIALAHYLIGNSLAMAGQTDAALDALERSAIHEVGKHYDLICEWMQVDPDLESLFDHPRFHAIVERVRTNVDANQL
ncbi:MAG: hypothetical protein AAGK04_09445 [Planctomycetota bacterium]